MAAKKPSAVDSNALNTLHNHLSMLAQTRAHILSVYMPEDTHAMMAAPSIKEIDREMIATVRLITALRAKLFPLDTAAAQVDLVQNAPSPSEKQ